MEELNSKIISVLMVGTDQERGGNQPINKIPIPLSPALYSFKRQLTVYNRDDIWCDFYVGA